MEQTVPDRLREQLIASRVAANKRLSADQQRRIAYGVGVGIAVLLLLVLILSVQYTGRYAGRVYRGVSVAGVAVGGLSQAEALAALDERVAGWAATPLPVRTAEGDHNWEIAPQDLGVTLDTAAAAEAAFAVGRDSNPLGNFFGWFGALRPFGGRELAIPATLDDGSLDLALRAWAPEATYAPTNAAFKVDAGGKLIIAADVDGLGFDFDGSRAALVAHAARLAVAPVTLSQAPVPAPINAAMLGGVESQARAIAAQPLVARYNGQSWTLDQQTLANAIAYRLVDGQLTLALDPARLRPFFDQVARAVGQPGANAQIVATNAGKYAIVPGKEGFGLDEGATLAQINTALNSGVHEITLTVSPQTPAIVAADLQPILTRLEGIVSTPVVIRVEGFRTRTLVRADLMPLIRLTEQPKSREKLAIGLDEAGLRALVGVLADEINQPVRDAKFAFANGTIEDVEKSQDGREVQVAPTLKVLNDAILGAVGSASPVITVTKPKVPSSDKAAMRTPDVLGYGSTYYGASIASRKHNVELATERLNGTIIPPGELFSFNAAVGAQTVENGYQEAYGIALVPGAGGGKGEVKTVNSIAGGICQVSTTLFQGVFKAGMPIEERNWHLFWVGYGDSPTGLHGLDATVDDQADLDFRWWNNTGGWIGIEAAANGEYVSVKIYGRDPGWEVQIDGPEITNVVKPDPAPVTEKTHDLPVGRKIMIEHAADGFNSAIRRQVFDRSGKLVQFNGKGMDTTFKSNYLPSRDRYQVGVPKSEPLD